MARGNFPPSLKNQDIVKIIFSDILLCGVLFLFFFVFFFSIQNLTKSVLVVHASEPQPDNNGEDWEDHEDNRKMDAPYCGRQMKVLYDSGWCKGEVKH